MTNTKKILCVLFALIALTLVMSLSIFAEEATTGTVYEVANESEFSTALSKAVDGDTIRFTSEVTFGTTLYQITKAVTIDLNGFKITTNRTRNQFELNNAGIVFTSSQDGGEIYHTGGICILLVKTADTIENIKLTSNRGENKIFALPDTNGCGGISVRGHINTIQNVTMDGPNLSYGIELYKVATTAELAQNVVLDNIINVSIDARRCGIKLAGNVGTATGCTFKGGVSGLEITAASDDKSYMSKINLVDCDVVGGSQAAEANGWSAYNINFVADADTTFTNSNNGIIFSFANYSGTNNVTFTVPGYAYADGVVKCTTPHNYVATVTNPTCTEAGYTKHACSKCVDFYTDSEVDALGHKYESVVTDPTCDTDGYTTYTCPVCGDSYVDNQIAANGHNYVETSRVEATEEADGYIEYTCSVCQGTKREAILYCDHNYVVVEEVKVSCLVDGYVKYECSLCNDIKEETTPKEAHTYDWHIGGCPKCNTVAVPDVEGGKVSTNLGYTVFFAASWAEINSNVSASSTYDVIRLTADTTASGYARVQNANILIDLGGHSITTSLSNASLYMYAAKGLVNGTIAHNGGRQGLWMANVGFIEDINIVMGGTFDNNATAILLSSNATYGGSNLGWMKNVTIDSKRDANGNYIENIGLFNHGLEFSNAGSIIGDLENVKVYSRGQAITIMAKQIGTMTNCVFDGNNIGLNIGNLQCDINLVNCVVSSETLAVRIGGATSNELSFNFDENTAISSNGSVYYIPDNIKNYVGFESLTTAVALVNGQLYGTLDAALEALLASTEKVTTFTLIGDLTLDAPIEINKTVKFSYGGGTFKIPTTGDKTYTEMTAPGYTVTAPNGAFVVTENGSLTLEGDGTLVGNENAIVSNGGEIIITAGTYEGYNPQNYVSSGSCVSNNNGVYTIAKTHTYDDGVLSDKVTYKVDGDCEVCGYVRGVAAVDYVYYATFEEAFAVALETGIKVDLAINAVIDGDVIWDLTGITFNFNGLTLTVNGSLTIKGGSFTQDISEYVPEGYCVSMNKNLYVVNVHEYVAGTPAEDGSVTYTCPACNDSYVINNALINGEYYLGTDLVVFNNGALSAMGGEYTYTYNVTTGMIDTDAGIFFQVIDGVIYFKGAQQLHQHTGEGYVTEEQENGAVNYVCPFCGEVMYVINNSAINGEYYLGTDLVVFNNGVLSAMGGEFTYTYNVTSGMIDTDAGIFFQVIDGVIYFKGAQQLHQHGEDDLIVETTDATCTENGSVVTICPFCGPLSEETIEATGHNYVETNRVPATTEAAGSVTYTCSSCGDSYTEELPKIEHTHTEEIIPAILPTPSVTGYTAGVKCSDCGETLVAPKAINVTDMADTKDPNFRVAAASLTLMDSIVVNYKSVVSAGYNNPYMVFVFKGEEYMVESSGVEAGTGRLIFDFDKVEAHWMNENIEAYVYAETAEGEYSRNMILEYSVKNYAINQLKKNDAALTTVISDLLVMGAKTQLYTGYKTNELVTDVVEAAGYTLTPTAFAGVDESYNIATPVTGDRTTGTDWKSGTVYLGSRTVLQLKFLTDDVDTLVVKVTVGNKTETYTKDDFDYEASSGRYVVNVDFFSAKQYGEPVVGTFERNGEQVGSTITYSVNAYAYRNANSASGATQDLIKALYVYGQSVVAYFK